MMSDFTFVPVNITHLFSNWMSDLEKEKKVSIEIISENGTVFIKIFNKD